MPTYRVKPGHVLPHQGEVLTEGATAELPTHVAEDVEVHYRIEPVTDSDAESVHELEFPLPRLAEAETDLPVVQEHHDAEGPAAPEPKVQE